MKTMEAKYPRIALQGTDGLTFVRKAEILYAIADGNYSHVYLTNGRKVKVLRKIKEVCQLLPDENFIRVHRSHLLNLEHVIRLNENEKVMMSNGESFAVSRNRKVNFIEKFTRI